MPDITLTPEQLEEKLAQARREAEERASAQFAAQGQELAELRAQRQAEKHAALINDWKAKGLLLPADEVGMREFMAALDAGQEFEFAAPGSDTPAKKAPLDFFAEFMAGRKPVVQLGAPAGSADPVQVVNVNDHKAVAEAAHEFMAARQKAGNPVSFEFAVQHVASQAQA